MKTFKILTLAIIIALVTINVLPADVYSLGDPECKVVFDASEPDEDGVFTVSMSIHNAKFNTFQFGLKYNKNAISPVNSLGQPVSTFEKFASLSNEARPLSSIGTYLDVSSGLIEFAGYVSPGKSIATDGMIEVSGYVVTGSGGLEIYTFHFKKNNTEEVGLNIATKSSGLPYSKSLPEGAGIFNDGENLSFTIEVNLPSSFGSESTMNPFMPEAPQAMTKQERLQKTIALQIGNYGAAANGVLIPVDSDNKNVRPYIDENNRTMVPVRFIAEQLGASVYWNKEDKKVTIVSGSKTVVMTVGSKSYIINDLPKNMDTEPVIIKGWDRTMVPIRFVTEALGMAIEWDSKNLLVLITELDVPWQLNRQVEKEATDSILLVISPEMPDSV